MPVKNVRDLLEAIDFIASRYATDTGKPGLIFRGLSNYDFKLLPGVYRTADAPDGTKEIRCFGDATEIEILQHFVKNAMSHVNHIDRDDLLTWLTYAQHFGAPTRLMDFSSNPLISLYFCCKKELETNGAVCVLHEKRYVRSLQLDNTPSRKKHDVLEEIVQNILDPEKPCTPYPVTFIPHYIDTRMEMQESRLLIWGSDKSAFETLAMPYGDMLLEEPEAFFCKIPIDRHSKRSLLRELSFLGISEKRLFPGLDGVGKYIAEYYRLAGEDY